MDYADLKAQIAAWTHHSGLEAHMDTFIDLTEAELNNKLRMSEMEDRATAVATGEYLTLPGGFLEMRNIQINSSPVKTLTYKTPAEMDRINQAQSGTPAYYTIIGDEIQFYPVPTSVTVEMIYYRAIDALNVATTTNFVTSRFPMTYLHGCLKHAYMFTRDEAGAALHGAEFDRLVAEMNKQSNKRKFSGAPLQITTA